MTAPSIPHASNCADPKSVEQAAYRLWESAVGEMWSRTYGCPTCGETAQSERFEAFEVEEEDNE